MFAKDMIGVNWVDFLIIVIVVRMCHIGTKTGTGIEIFKLFAVWLATVVTLQLYSRPLGDFLHRNLPALPLDAADAFMFVALATVTILLVRMIRESFFLLIRIEAQNSLNKWGGFLLGFFRGLWISSFVLVFMAVSTVQTFETSAKTSLFGHKLIHFAPSVYKGSHKGLIASLFDSELNKDIFEVVER